METSKGLAEYRSDDETLYISSSASLKLELEQSDFDGPVDVFGRTSGFLITVESKTEFLVAPLLPSRWENPPHTVKSEDHPSDILGLVVSRIELVSDLRLSGKNCWGDTSPFGKCEEPISDRLGLFLSRKELVSDLRLSVRDG